MEKGSWKEGLQMAFWVVLSIVGFGLVLWYAAGA